MMWYCYFVNPDEPDINKPNKRWEPEPLHIEKILPKDLPAEKRKDKDVPKKRVIIIDI